MLDGALVCSCLVLGVEAEGSQIETVEGIAHQDKLHVIQEKFLEHAALQCGICTPGLIVSTKALLEENPQPTEEEARYYLAGNLCRCTGYDKIIKAVMDAADVMRQGNSKPRGRKKITNRNQHKGAAGKTGRRVAGRVRDGQKVR